MKAWIRMPLELLQRNGLSKSAAITLGVIIDRCTDTTTGTAAITQAELSHESGYDPRTIRRALIELEALELIAHERTGRASTYSLTGCVELLPPKQRSVAAATKTRAAAKQAAYESCVNRFDKGVSK